MAGPVSVALFRLPCFGWMAVSIAFGIMTSTVLVLLVVPSLYAVLADLGFVANDTAISG